VNILDDAAFRAAGPPKKKPKPPAALPGNLRAHENRAAGRPAPSAPPRALPGNARVADQQAAAMQANLAHLPAALSQEDRRAIIQQAAMRAGTANAHVVAEAARKLGPDGIRDDAKHGLLQDVARALNLSLSPGNIAATVREAATGDVALSGLIGINPLLGLVANQQGLAPELGGAQRRTEKQVGKVAPAKVQAVVDAAPAEMLHRIGIRSAKLDQVRQRARDLPGTYDIVKSRSAKPRTLDPNEFHALAWTFSEHTSEPTLGGFYAALSEVARHASQHQTHPTVDGLFEQAWRRWEATAPGQVTGFRQRFTSNR